VKALSIGVLACGLLGAAPAFAVAGSISGTVTDAASTQPVANFLVCAFAQTAIGETGGCARTEEVGNYTIAGLADEEYEVAFEGEREFNYLTQYWDGSETYGDFDPVEVSAAAPDVSGIDAALHPGAEISGTLRETGTGRALSGVSVSLLQPVTEEVLRFTETDAAGLYAFRGRPAGSYVVGFSHTMFGAQNADCYSAQYHDGVSDFAGATPLNVAPPEVLTGIDGEVAFTCPRAQPIQVTLLPLPPPREAPKRCRKGFRKKRIGGKTRCLRKRHGHRHRNGHGLSR